MPITLKIEIFSFKKIIDPKVVNRKTIVAKIGYALERSLKVNTLSQIMKEVAYNTRPTMMKGLKAAFESSITILLFSPDNPPKEITPFFRRIFAVTFIKTLVKRRCQKPMM